MSRTELGIRAAFGAAVMLAAATASILAFPGWDDSRLGLLLLGAWVVLPAAIGVALSAPRFRVASLMSSTAGAAMGWVAFALALFITDDVYDGDKSAGVLLGLVVALIAIAAIPVVAMGMAASILAAQRGAQQKP